MRVLKYPGSKWNLAPFIVSLIPDHHTYLEPFFGSGAVFFTKKPSLIETVNDIDENVYLLYKLIRDNTEELNSRIAMTPYSRKDYENCYIEKPESDMDKVMNFLIGCWQGRGYRANGYRTGWRNDVIGREQMYAARDWYGLPDKIVSIVDRLKQCQIENRDAIELIKRHNAKGVFIYVDPPYLLSTRRHEQYSHEMKEADHVKLIEVLLNHKGKVMLSGYEHELYDQMLVGWKKVKLEATAEYGLPRTESLWLNYDDNQQLSIFD